MCDSSAGSIKIIVEILVQKVGKESVYNTIIGNQRLHGESNCNDQILIDFATGNVLSINSVEKL